MESERTMTPEEREWVVATLRQGWLGRIGAETVTDRIIAPLLADAERRGAEKGWDRGYIDARADDIASLQNEVAGMVSPAATRNPYRVDPDQRKDRNHA
jgi:hypothetical protein